MENNGWEYDEVSLARDVEVSCRLERLSRENHPCNIFLGAVTHRQLKLLELDNNGGLWRDKRYIDSLRSFLNGFGIFDRENYGHVEIHSNEGTSASL